ncbi:MAG: beta-ketoacyl-ACP synthase II [Deltaproteobacteria bacterium]|nr:beta-ketoacyl-ACP synthase II [Deltaproteobacteria bacterium]
MALKIRKTVGFRRVVVTGLGLVSPLGNEVPTTWKRLLAGESGVTQVTRFGEDLEEFSQRFKAPKDFPLIAGEVKNFDLKELMTARKQNLDKEDLKLLKYTDRFAQYALAASLEAINDSGLDLEAEDPNRVGIIIASGMGGVSSWEEQHEKLLYEGVKKISPFLVPRLLPNLAAGNVSISFRAKGPNAALSTACAAGAHAIGAAFRSIQLGEAELMASGGAEAAITPLTMTGFYRMGALATGFNDRPAQASRPFDQEHRGFVMADGAGILILEELEHARQRGAKIYAEIIGFGMTGDARHITDPDLEGAIRCMEVALKDAGISAQEVAYINPHATSTPVGDRNEAQAIKLLTRNSSPGPLVSATKSMTGHLLGAAGAVEAIFTILSLKQGRVPPTINLEVVDPECDGLNFVKNQARAVSLRYALSNSFGFGGTNATLVFQRYEA